MSDFDDCQKNQGVFSRFLLLLGKFGNLMANKESF